MKAFAYVDARNEKEAVQALRFMGGVAMPLAGGQDLLARLKDYVTSADRIVNVKGALETTVTSTADGGLKIGAAMKIVDLMENPQVQRLYPSVIASAGDIGTPQIRNQGTVGGNINQRPRPSAIGRRSPPLPVRATKPLRRVIRRWTTTSRTCRPKLFSAICRRCQ